LDNRRDRIARKRWFDAATRRKLLGRHRKVVAPPGQHGQDRRLAISDPQNLDTQRPDPANAFGKVLVSSRARAAGNLIIANWDGDWNKGSHR
jgi:hypothetical protein